MAVMLETLNLKQQALTLDSPSYISVPCVNAGCRIGFPMRVLCGCCGPPLKGLVGPPLKGLVRRHGNLEDNPQPFKTQEFPDVTSFG